MDKFNINDYLYERDKINNRGKCKVCSSNVSWSRDKVASHKRKSCIENLTEENKEIFAIKKPRMSDQQSIFVIDELLDQPQQEKLSETKKQKIDAALSHFFFRTGISFRIADSDAFKKLVYELNPDYSEVMPKSKKICTQLLQQEHIKLLDVLNKLLDNATELTLTSDGWANVRGEHLVNFVVKAPGHKPIFYKAIDTSGTPQTSEAIAGDIISVLNEIGAQKFCAVITDNANVMRRAWQLIESEFPHISVNGCGAHVMNLLIKDIMEINAHKNVASNASKIIKFVNNHYIVSAKFEDIRKELGVAHKLSLPVATRWYTHFNSLNDLADAKYALIKLVDSEPSIAEISPKEKSKDVINLIKSNGFWDVVTKVIKIIEFPTKIIGKLERDDSKLNIVYHYFGELFKLFEDQHLIQQLVKKRWDFIMTESIGVSYMLSPSYAINNFYVDEDKLDIMGQIKSLAIARYGTEIGQKVLPELTGFMHKMQNLNISRQETLKNIDAVDYWRLVGANEFPNLCKIAVSVCGIPCTSAASERIWSTYKFIHSRLRNRLTNDKVEKLIFIYVNSSILDEFDTEDYICEDLFASIDEMNS